MAPSVPTAPHPAPRPEALAPLGWTGRDAEWLTLVCLHSGVFVRAQFAHHYRCSRQTAMRFARRVTAAGLAREHPFPGTRTNQRLCHVHGRALYRALGIDALRHRRYPSEAVLWRRLLSLDAVVQYPDLRWLPTEQDKVRYFAELGVDPAVLPRRVYPGKTGTTTRYFAWKLPIAGDARAATFVYADPGLDTTAQLERWCQEHAALWTAVKTHALEVHVVAVARTLDADTRHAGFLGRRISGTAADPLSAAELRTLEEVERAVIDNDGPALDRWGGFMPAARVLADLQDRHRAGAAPGPLLDRLETHVATRLENDVYGS